NIAQERAAGEKAAIDEEVEPDHVRSDRCDKKRGQGFALRPERNERDHMYRSHHVGDIPHFGEQLYEAEPEIRVIEVAGRLAQDTEHAEDRHDEYEREDNLACTMKEFFHTVTTR